MYVSILSVMNSLEATSHYEETQLYTIKSLKLIVLHHALATRYLARTALTAVGRGTIIEDSRFTSVQLKNKLQCH